jgi:hypothetical protein
LVGVELEDDGGTGTAGSHWDQRVMLTEFMCGEPSRFQNVKSAISLALMQAGRGKWGGKGRREGGRKTLNPKP